jgi:hypothetical protein
MVQNVKDYFAVTAAVMLAIANKVEVKIRLDANIVGHLRGFSPG